MGYEGKLTVSRIEHYLLIESDDKKFTLRAYHRDYEISSAVKNL